MTEKHTVFSGSIPELYDRHLGPVFFEPYAADLARRVNAGAGAGAGDTVLETACGTGILTRQLRASLPAATRLVATDLNEAMIDYARVKLGNPAGIEWRTADAAALPFDDGAFSTLACQFGVMFVPDKAACFREARRVLRKGGLFAFNVWDSLAQNPFAKAAHETIGSFFPEDPPTFYQVPFGFHDREVLRKHMTDAGFDDIAVETVKFEARAETARFFATGLVKGSPVSIAIQDRGGSHDAIVDAVAAAIAKIGGERPFATLMQAVVVTGKAR